MAIGYCVKRPVSVVITFTDKTVILGGNFCTNSQSTCPREAGEGYEKCFSICGQLGHAEAVAIRLLIAHGVKPDKVAHVDVYNHEGPCDACRRLLDYHGLTARTRFHPHSLPAPIDEITRENVDKEYALSRPGPHSKQYNGGW